MRKCSLSLTVYPPSRWLVWRVENTVCDWVLFAGPISVIVEK